MKSASSNEGMESFIWQNKTPSRISEFSENDPNDYDFKKKLEDLRLEIEKIPYQGESKYGKETGGRNRNKYDIAKITGREDAYSRASDVLEDYFNPNDKGGGYDANTIEWGLNEKSRSTEAKNRLQAIQYMINFVHKYSPDFKGQIPSMFYTENVDTFLKDSRGISNTQEAIRQLNDSFNINTHDEKFGNGPRKNSDNLNQITVSVELMAKLRAEVRRILEKNEKDGPENLDESLTNQQSIEQKTMMANVLRINEDEVDTRWYNWMKKITPAMAQNTYDNDFDEYGDFDEGIMDSSLENDLEEKLDEPFLEPKTQAFIKWLGSPDGQEFLSGSNQKTADKWNNFGEYVKYKMAYGRRLASLDSNHKKYEGMA